MPQTQTEKRLTAKSSRSSTKSLYKVTATPENVLKSRHYRLNKVNRPKIIHSDIDIKNIVLSDKRRALLSVLKDKRPLLNYEIDFSSPLQVSGKNNDLECIKTVKTHTKSKINNHASQSKLFPLTNFATEEELNFAIERA